MEQRTVDLVEGVVDALVADRPNALPAHLDESCLLHLPGRSGFGGDYCGVEAIRALLDRMEQACAGQLHFEPIGVVVVDEGHVCVKGRLHGRRVRRSLDTVVWVQADFAGQMVHEAWLECADQPAWDAFWS